MSIGTRLGPPGFVAQDTPETIEIEEVVPDGLESGDWVVAGIVFVAAVVLAIIARRAVTRLFTARNAPVGVGRLVGRFVGAAIVIAGFVYALSSLDIRIAPILGALGIVGIALAFALRDILENFIAGLMLQTRRPFAIGDEVETNDWEGVVEDVNTRALILKTFEGERVVIPSAMVLKNPIQNHTAFDYRRTTVSVGVSYDTDLSAARDAMLRATREAEGVLAAPSPEAYVEELGEFSIDFALRYWHEPRVAEFWRVRDRVIEAVFDALADAGVEVPFPQRTLHLPPQLAQELELWARRLANSSR